LVPIHSISPRQTRSKRKSIELSKSSADASTGNSKTALNPGNKALGAGIVQAADGSSSLATGTPARSNASSSKKKESKTDEEILNELEPGVSRPLPPAMLPYFEGDFWVAEGELLLKLFIKDDIKKKLEEEEEKLLDAGGPRRRKKRKTKNYAEEKISALLVGDSKQYKAVVGTSLDSSKTKGADEKPGHGNKNGSSKKAGEKKEDEEDEEKFEKLSKERRDKETLRLMRRLATLMETMKPDFLVCKLKHTCSRCHKYILNGTRYKCNCCESIGRPFNLCQACHDIESQKSNLNKTLHQVHCEQVREDAAYSLGGGGNSGFKRVLSLDRDILAKNKKKDEANCSAKGNATGKDGKLTKMKSATSGQDSSKPVNTLAVKKELQKSKSELVEDKNECKSKDNVRQEKKAEKKSNDGAIQLSSPPPSKKALIPDKVKANEQRRSRALAAKRATYERLIEVMAWDDEKHVMTTAEESTVAETKDPDDKLDCPILNTRLALLGVCQGNRYQFDQKRRAKHSTMMLLYHLHNPKVPLYVHTCNECQKDILGNCRFNCSQCPDFDLCARCYRDVHHIHRLKRIEVDVSGTSSEETNKEDRKKRSLSLFLESLVHATSCGGCSRPECRKMKDLLQHRTLCKIRASGGCDTCQRILCLLQIHARQCKVPDCKVLYCKVLKRRILVNKGRKRLQNTQQQRQGPGGGSSGHGKKKDGDKVKEETVTKVKEETVTKVKEETVAKS